MTVAVRYHSRSGNTRKVAEAIAKAVDVEARTCDAPLSEPVELLFLGGAVYGGDVDSGLSGFIGTLTPDLVKRVAVFGTSAIAKSPCDKIKEQVEGRGIPVTGDPFQCYGKFTLLRRGHPNQEDLNRAAGFARAAVE